MLSLLRLTVLLIACHQASTLSLSLASLAKLFNCSDVWSLFGGKADETKLKVNLTLVGTIEKPGPDCTNDTEVETTKEETGKVAETTQKTTVLPEVTQRTTSVSLLEPHCPKKLFNQVAGGCFKVLSGAIIGWNAQKKCKQYARDNNLPEKNVNMGAIRNDKQNEAVLRLALENENITKHGENPKEHFGSKHMLIGIWHTDPAGTVDPVWRYVDTNETLVYENWNKGQPDNHGLSERCVHLYLVADAGSFPKVVGKWNDIRCNTINAAVLCEYKESASSAQNHGKTAA